MCAQPPLNQSMPDFYKLPSGAIIGSVILEGVLPVETLHSSSAQLAALKLEESAFVDNTKGRYT